ncbi:MAG: Gfo/Idh/MocA family oxidoreductase [Anaerolineae bacterium]|nr:Gfo/Idh/MocA family oxidoreductase [Anaerolineae bacterium]MBT3712150.1 Gfo/Idh/MocA family oxidoreductase [Anaerolineae bacterium]MBT4311563.1 Gfo/Idh/MocA family oxidoreductase [Anaerolineae bacterium]MBT4457264.1 Gfo/Idh/MocA family oxidoreductase [Anaerolineae bacterium]MBT4842440.1 Gfo/Idh/MocA family oxidoreductase [Anaerolineae bacterium]
MKFLIAGLGSIGHRHLNMLRDLGQDNIVLYRTHQSTIDDEELAGIPVETDLQAALNLKPDAVIVANPTSLHMDVAIPAAKAGCHILLEKPISDDLSRVDKLRRAAEKSGSRILVGFQFRYHPTLNKARDLINEGALGKVLSFHSHWGEYLPNWHPWEDYRESYAARADLGGGVIGTLTHPIDYLRYILGEVEETASIQGHVSPLELSGVEDVGEIGIKFKSGAIGAVHINYFQRPPDHRLEIVGTKGTFRWNNDDGVLQHYNMPEEFGTWSANPSAPVHTIYELPDDFERNYLFVEQMKHFIEIVEGKAEPRCSLDDGIEVQKLVENIRK